MTTVQILKAAKRKIQKGWCQGFAARDAKDLGVNPVSSKATQWCAYGALRCVNLYGDVSEPLYFLNLVVARIAKKSILKAPDVVYYNDAKGRTKEQILRVYDKAIELAEKKAILR